MSRSSSLSSLLGRSLARRTLTTAASASFLRPFLPASASTSPSSSLLRRSLSSTPRRWDSATPGISAPKGSLPGSASFDGSSGITATWHPAEGNESKAPLRIDQEPKLSLTFTCTATLDPPTPPPSSPEAALPPSATPPKDVLCNHRSTHTFSKQAYTKGIVLVQCPSCENRHLIADHIGWFPEVTEADGGKRVMKDIQDIMREKGEEVKRGSLSGGEGGTIEFYQ